MSQALRTAESARRRLWLRDAVRALGPCLTVGSSLGLLGAFAARLLDRPNAAWAAVAAGAISGVIAAAARASARVLSAERAAIEIDRALGMRDRFAAGVAFDRAGGAGAEDSAFVVLAVREAEQASASVNLRAAAPLRFGAWWRVWPAALTAAVAAALFLPPLDRSGSSPSQVREKQARDAARREETSTQIASLQRSAERSAQKAADPAAAERLRALDELRKDLERGDLTPEQARARAADAVERAASSLDRGAEQAERSLDAVGERLANLRPGDLGNEAREFGEALRRGDFGKAAEALDQLERRADDPASAASAPAEPLAQEDRERLARDLESIAEQIARPETGAESPSADAAERAKEALSRGEETRDIAERLAKETDQDTLREGLERAGMEPDAADRLARDAARENREREARLKAEEHSRDLGESLRDAAKDLRKPDAPEPPPQPSAPPTPPESKPAPPAEQPEPQQPQGETQQPDNGGDKGDQQRQRGNQAETKQKQQQGDQNQQNQRGEQRGQPKQGDQQQGDQQPGEQQRGTPSERGEQRQRGDSQRQGGQSGAPKNQEGRRQGAAPQIQQGQSGQEQQTGAQPSSNQRQGGGENGDPNRNVERAKKAIESLRRAQQTAAGQRKGAEEMREQARRALDKAPADENQQADRWAREMAREMGREPGGGGAGNEPHAKGPQQQAGPVAAGSRRTEDVDIRRGARPGEPQGRVGGEFTDPSAPPPPRGASANASPEDLAREAASSAERAVEEQAPPPRLRRVVKDYFRRLPDAVAPRPPAPEAKDVEPPAKPQGS